MPEAMTGGPRRQIAAILFADVHGYSRLMSRNEERTYQRVTQALRLIRSLIGDYGGRVEHVAGDGVLALFESAAQALQFAIAIQREFRNDAVWNADDEPITFRIGVNLGEVFFGGEAIQGHSINVAARIQALAHPGGICITNAVERAVRDTLELEIRPLGLRSLRNIGEPVEVFAIEINGPAVPVSAGSIPRGVQALEPPTEASVAILPLDNLSRDPRDQHLCDGITGDVISNLSRFRDLLVIARHSAFLFKDRHVPPDQIGRRLGVHYLLTGGLQRSGNKIRLGVELAEAESGKVIWSDRYKGDLEEVFAFQDEVTAMIAARLQVQIAAAERRRLGAEDSPDLQAYGLILRGQNLVTLLRRESNLHARRLFEEAAETDPEYARSYAGLARTYQEDWRYRWSDTPELCLERAVSWAERAIELDPSDARGHAAFGHACLYRRQHDESLAAYGRATELNPNDADVLAETGHCISCCGDPERALQLMSRAMRLNPFHPDWYLWVRGEIHFDLREYQECIRTLMQMHDKSQAHRLVAASHALLGNMPEARRHAEQVLFTQPGFSIQQWRDIPPDRNPEPRDRFIEGLRKAGLK